MTFLEKWELEHPSNDIFVMPMGCPADYGYESVNHALYQKGKCYRSPTCTCHGCWGREIPMKEKEANRNAEYNIPSRYGYWQVSTEGDEEGKSIRNLGVYHGNIDEIAFALADKVMWSLNFKLIDPDDIPTSKEYKTKIDICLDLKGVPYGDSKTREHIVKAMLAETNIEVKNSGSYGKVSLVRPEDPDRIREAKIEKALNKLTNEEKELLRDYLTHL